MSTAVRRLGLAVQRAARDSARPVVILLGLRPGAGITTLAGALRRVLVAEGHQVRLLEGDVMTIAPALHDDDAITIIDGGAALAGRGPVLDAGWRPLLAGVVVVVCAERDVGADADEAAALLDALELPVIGVVWSGIAAPPATDIVASFRRRARAIQERLAEASHRLHRLVAPGGTR